MEISELLGKTLTAIEVNGEEDIITFTTKCDETYRMLHYQDCCESVYIADIEGDLEDLLNSPITLAEEAGNEQAKILQLIGALPNTQSDESETWTFYRLATVKGYVVIRWCGSSNGYYSESVDFELIGA